MQYTSPRETILNTLGALIIDIKEGRTSFSLAMVQAMIDGTNRAEENASYDTLMEGLLTAAASDNYTAPYAVGMVKQALGLRVCGRCNKFCRRTCPR